MYLLQEPSVRPVGLVYFMNTRLRSVRVYERSPGHFLRKFYWGGKIPQIEFVPPAQESSGHLHVR